MFTFKKIASVLASAVMISSTVALAAAANYPDPFVKGGMADVAIVYGGADALNTDLLAAADISTSLNTELAKQTATSGGSTSGTASGGDAFALFGSTKLYLNDTLNAQRATVTADDIPSILAD